MTDCGGHSDTSGHEHEIVACRRCSYSWKVTQRELLILEVLILKLVQRTNALQSPKIETTPL